MDMISNELLELDKFKFKSSIIPVLRDLIDTRNFVRHVDAQQTLTQKGKNALPVLHKLLQSKYVDTRREALKIIKNIANQSSILYAINMLEDWDSDIRWIGAEVLIRIGRLSIKPLIERLLSVNGTSHKMRHGAHHVLSELITEEDPEELKKLLLMLKSDSLHPEIIITEAAIIIDQELV